MNKVAERSSAMGKNNKRRTRAPSRELEDRKTIELFGDSGKT
jgi:hypothetical protein